MLIAQGPLRVSLFGGGSDLPAFLESNEGAVLSFAIDRCVFIVGHPFTHREGIVLKYSKTEDVQSASELQHPIARVVLERYGVTNIDIAVMSDVPAGTGMGSSSAFTVAFLAFVRRLRGLSTSEVNLAKEACEIEIEVLKEPIGYQDQWASAIGGINVLRFEQHEVHVEEVAVPPATVHALESNLHLIPMGNPRSARAILQEQGVELTSGSKATAITRKMVDLVSEGRHALLTNIDDLGPLLDQAWFLKREIAQGISNSDIDIAYERGLVAGATGGKLLGAGGSGYFAFYVPANEHERFAAMHPQRLDFRVSIQGAGIIHES